MKRRLAVLLALITVLCLIAGCSTSESDKKAEATTEGTEDYFEDMPQEPRVKNPEKYVKLGSYQGLTVTKESEEVTDKEVENEINNNLGTDLVDVTDREKVQKGDILDIDYETTVDGELVEDYTMTGREYYMGENEFSFLKNDIDKNLIGKKVGDTFDVENVFIDNLDEDIFDYSEYDDENYEEALGADDLGGDAFDDDGQEPFEEEAEGEDDTDEQLAGKACTMTITINGIKKEVTQKLNDDYVKENTDYKTVEEYRAGIKKELQQVKKEQVENDAVSNLFKQIVDNSEQLKDFPEDLVKEEEDYLTENISMDMSENMEEDEEMAFDEYFKKNYPEYKDVKEYAVFNLKYSCVYDLLLEAYKIKPTDKQIDEAAKLYLQDGYENVDQVKEEIPREELKAVAEEELLIEKLKADNKFVEAGSK